MTSLLLLWIVLGIAAQVVIYLGIGFLRHWRRYRQLRDGALEIDIPVTQATPMVVDVPAPAAWTGYRTFRVDRKVVEDANRSVCSFYLVPDDLQPLPSFQPGQFLTFRLDVPTASGGMEQIIRCYSLSDAPRPDYYRVSIKRVPAPIDSDVPPGRSSNFFHDHIVVGSRLQVRAPAGHFYIERSDAPVVLIGGGIGITPMLSMLNWCLAEQPGREVWLFYGVRNSREQVMKARLDALAEEHSNFHWRLCHSDPSRGDGAGRDFHHAGRVDVQLLRSQLPLRPYHFYICGPTPMMEVLVAELEEWGVPDARIHFEAFGPASIKRRSTASQTPRNEVTGDGITVTFARSGRQLAWQPAAGSLLEFAESNGISVNSGCRAGGCGSCQTTIQAGEVGYHQTPDYDPEPGSCLLCVCTPKTSMVLEA